MTSRSDTSSGARRTMRTMSIYQSVLLGKWLEGNREALERTQASYDAAARLASSALGFEVPASWFATICKQSPKLRWQRPPAAPKRTTPPDMEAMLALHAELVDRVAKLESEMAAMQLGWGRPQ